MSKQKQALYPKLQARGPFTVEASGYEPVEGETIPRRHPSAQDKLATTPHKDVKTIFDIIKYSADKFGNAKAMGMRKVVRTHTENKKVKKTIDGETKEVEKTWTYFELSEYSYISFVEYEKMVLAVGAGLRNLGLSKGDRVHLFAATRYGLQFFDFRLGHLLGAHIYPVPTGLPHPTVQCPSLCQWSLPTILSVKQACSIP